MSCVHKADKSSVGHTCSPPPMCLLMRAAAIFQPSSPSARRGNRYSAATEPATVAANLARHMLLCYFYLCIIWAAAKAHVVDRTTYLSEAQDSLRNMQGLHFGGQCDMNWLVSHGPLLVANCSINPPSFEGTFCRKWKLANTPPPASLNKSPVKLAPTHQLPG